jgi:alpha-N-arabinofuranosidase
MRPEYAADLFRRYQTFLRAPAGESIMKIAGGSYRDDYAFTEVMMREAHAFMNGLSFHYYTFPLGSFEHKGPATGFGEAEWISTLSRGLKMDELLTRHGAIMDKYDPEKKVALVVD